MRQRRKAPRYSFVIPVYNEEEVLPLLVDRMKDLFVRLDGDAEAIFIDDGSTDGSVDCLGRLGAGDARFRLVELSRNFGHQMAITAGMDAAAGEAVIVMDADLQDPPEVVLELIAKWRDGYEIVYARRVRRDGETWFKRSTASLFYWLLARVTKIDIPRDVGDFRLVGRKALETFRDMPEHDRFVRGMFAWMGFKQTAVSFERPPRARGETKYPFWKMAHLAVHGIVSFSDTPLRMALWGGLTVSLLALGYGVYAMLAWALEAGIAQGWTSTIVVVSFLCGINLFMTGVVGLYVGGIYSEVKRRPLYVVSKTTSFGDMHPTGKEAGLGAVVSRRTG
ncbi:glycosyltransferase family 2 protein [Aminobacter aganoensis]